MLRKRITIIDPDTEFCLAVSSIIKYSPDFLINKIYHDCKEAIRKLTDDYSEIIIMDLDFPDMAGTDFIYKAREKISALNILVLSNYEDERIIFQSLAYGACGYLLKKNCLSQLMQALSIVSAGGSPLDPVIARKVIRSLQISQFSPLSMRETSVLKLLIQGKTYTHISQDLFISSETVKTHIKNIYKKLKVNSKAEAVRKAIEEQLVVSHLGFNFQ